MPAIQKAMRQKSIRFYIGFTSGLFVVAVLILTIQTGSRKHNVAPGPMNSGHGSLTCEECHVKSKGTFRQQLQADILYLLGKRVTPVTVGFNHVSNKDCADCHRNPKDHHPVYRFMEPKYTKVRQDIHAQTCNACHLEHHGTRVTIEPGFCSHCHEKLVLKKDPLDTTHKQLVKNKRWKTCLGCHDYHGNYLYKVPKKLIAAISIKKIIGYLHGGQSPYGLYKRYKARKTRHDHNS